MIPVSNLPRLPKNERGIALITAVLVVLLSSVLVVTFMTTTSGERSLSSNVQTAKGSLYAADAGVRTQQQVLANLAKAKLDSCVAGWSGTGLVITNPANLFPNGTFTVTSTNPSFSASGTIVYSDTSISPTAQAYDYRFTIQATGNVRSTGTRSVQSNGILRVSAERGSFADYLIFTNTHSNAAGSAIWFTSDGHFDGRVHTNTTFRFAYNPTFQDLVTQSAAQAYFYNNGSPIQLNANNNGTKDVPAFYGGFQRNQPTVPLPTNSFNQQAAAIRYSTTNTSAAPPNSEINRYISGGSNTSSSTPPNGIYLNQLGGNLGGIYVQGNLDQCKMWADTTNNRQWYQLKQGSTYRTILVDVAANQTKVWNSTNTAGAPTSTYSQVPLGLMYVNGGISDLRGPDRSGSTVLPAIAENNKLLIATTDDIVVQRDVTMDSYTSANNVLGLYSSGGSVRVGSGAPDDCNLDAYVMATGSSGEFTVDNYNSGSPRGTFHLRGGMVASYYGGFYTFNTSGVLQTGFARDFHYDRRGLIPPYFPSTTRFNADTPSARTLAWKEI